MNLTVYTGLLRLAAPIILRLLERKAKKAGGRWGVRAPERFGRYSSPHYNHNHLKEQFERPVWVHAVSLGETRAAEPLLRALLETGLPVLLSHMTATGRAMGEQLFSDAIERGQLQQAWIPYDLPEAVQGFFEYWRPRCGILIEREVWPNLLAEAEQREVPMIVVSARFSESALKQARWLGRAQRDAFESLSLILAQTSDDAERLRSYGLEQIKICGNLKFDVPVATTLVAETQALKEQLQRPVIVIASTRNGEEALFLKQLSQETRAAAESTQPTPLYIIVPRHPERFELVQTLLEQSTLSSCRRSQQSSASLLASTDVLLGDTIGEMFFYYGLADVAIIGGSFEDFGGQNNIEASAVGVPVIVGPHTKNFKQAVDDALAAGAARRVETAAAAISLAEQLIESPAERTAMAQAAMDWMTLHRGSTTRTMQALAPYLK